MRTAEEQYQKQFNEIRQRWKRGRRRRALGMLITGVIGAIAALISHFFFNAAKFCIFLEKDADNTGII